MKILIVFFSLVFSSFSFCDANEDGKSFASEMNISMDGIAKGLDSNDVPNYQGTEVDETDYYDDGLGIETEAKNSLSQTLRQTLYTRAEVIGRITI